jgi:hypothetical protein
MIKRGRKKLICAVPDRFDQPDEERKGPEPDVPVKEDQAGYCNNDEEGLNEKVDVFHDNPGLLLVHISIKLILFLDDRLTEHFLFLSRFQKKLREIMEQ